MLNKRVKSLPASWCFANMWQELGIAFSMLLVIEGIIPFLYPQRWKNMVQALAEIDNKSMRVMGLISMLLGTGLLYLVH